MVMTPPVFVQQVKAEVAKGPSVYDAKELKKDFVAICSEDRDDNEGLPFWLGKVVKTREVTEKADDDEDDEEDEDESDDDEPLLKKKKTNNKIEVQVKEYTQVLKNKGTKDVKNSDRTYKESKPERGSKATSVLTWVPIESIMYHFDKLTSTHSISKEDANWIVYTAEVWLKSDCDSNPVGVKEMVTELGYKMVPKR